MPDHDSRDPDVPPPAESSEISLWALSNADGDCDHPPAAVEFVGDDGRNLYFDCTNCGTALVATDAVHLLSK